MWTGCQFLQQLRSSCLQGMPLTAATCRDLTAYDWQALRLPADVYRKYCVWHFIQCAPAIILSFQLFAALSLSHRMRPSPSESINMTNMWHKQIIMIKDSDLKVCPGEIHCQILTDACKNTFSYTSGAACAHTNRNICDEQTHIHTHTHTFVLLTQHNHSLRPPLDTNIHTSSDISARTNRHNDASPQWVTEPVQRETLAFCQGFSQDCTSSSHSQHAAEHNNRTNARERDR